MFFSTEYNYILSNHEDLEKREAVVWWRTRHPRALQDVNGIIRSVIFIFKLNFVADFQKT